MKADRSGNRNKLTRGLLMVALLFSLFACLGSDIYSQDRLKLSQRSELALVTEQLVNQAESLKQAQKLSRFSVAIKIGQSRALIAYNKWIRHQTKILYFNNFVFVRSSQSIQLKTIPASFNEPFPASFRG